MGIRSMLKNRIVDYGVDTETYNTPSYGLKSIQVADSDGNVHYFSTDDWSQSDLDIRFEICKKFVAWINEIKFPGTMAFFNINFDFSQFAYYLINQSGFQYVEHTERLSPGQIRVLESDRQLYKVELVNNRGCRIRMIDIANFLTGTSLNRACSDWIGKQKLEVGSKDFLKAAPTQLEINYALHDARLTLELFQRLREESVIEGKTVTIAGRTISHFKDFLKSEWGQDFNQFVFGTKDKELVESYTQKIEECLRAFTRGGECQAIHTGVFENCHHIDARSMYPTQMVRDFIPYGELLDNEPESKHFTIYYPRGFFELKEGKIPFLQFRRKSQCLQYSYLHVYEPGDYVKDFYLDGTYPIWDAELEVIEDCYVFINVDLTKRQYIRAVENRALKQYVNMLYEGKRNNSGTKRQYYKILLNSLYGKFLSRPDGVIISYSGGERHKEEDNDRPTYYLPLGMWIAMMGRVTLHKAMSSIPYENVLYCDTDSIIFIGDKFPDVHLGENLGDWSIENDDFTANIVGAKTYQELNSDGSIITKCAGLSSVILPTVKFGELEIGAKYTVLKSVRDKDYWFINLERTTFEVNNRLSILREH